MIDKRIFCIEVTPSCDLWREDTPMAPIGGLVGISHQNFRLHQFFSINYSYLKFFAIWPSCYFIKKYIKWFPMLIFKKYKMVYHVYTDCDVNRRGVARLEESVTKTRAARRVLVNLIYDYCKV